MLGVEAVQQFFLGTLVETLRKLKYGSSTNCTRIILNFITVLLTRTIAIFLFHKKAHLFEQTTTVTIRKQFI